MSTHLDTYKIAGIFAGVAGAAALFGFVVSALYDIGYYGELGYNLSEVPTTFSDHMRSCINWIPLSLSIAAGVVFSVVFVGRVQGGLTDREIIEASSNPSMAFFVRFGGTFLFMFLCILHVVFYIMYGDVFRMMLPFTAAMAWVAISSLLQYHPVIIERRGRGLIIFLIVAPALCILAYLYGRQDAYTDIHFKQDSTIIDTIKYGEVSGNLLRSLENGFVIYMPEFKAVRFFPLSEVHSVLKFVDQRPYPGLVGPKQEPASDSTPVFSAPR